MCSLSHSPLNEELTFMLLPCHFRWLYAYKRKSRNWRMNWPLSLGSRGQRRSQKQSSFSKPADIFFNSASLCELLCWPWCYEFTSKRQGLLGQSEIACRRQLRVAAFHEKLDKAGGVFAASALRKQRTEHGVDGSILLCQLKRRDCIIVMQL